MAFYNNLISFHDHTDIFYNGMDKWTVAISNSSTFINNYDRLLHEGMHQVHNSYTKSSLPKSMQPSIPPIGQRLSFSTSQVDLTHSDDYHYCIEVKTIVVMLMIFTIVTT